MPVKIAYLILAYNKPDQLLRLVCRLHGGDTYFFIHIDKRTHESVYLQCVAALGPFRNVHFIRRYASPWGGFGIVLAALEAIAEVFRRQIPADYLVLLTGQDYPIKDNLQIQDFFERSGGLSYLDYDEVPSAVCTDAIRRLETWQLRLFGRSFYLPHRGITVAALRRPSLWPLLFVSYCMPRKRKPPRGYKPFVGSAYWALARSAAQYVNEANRKQRYLFRYFRTVRCCDELFFQTLLLNSPLAGDIRNFNIHYTDWSEGGSHPALIAPDHLDKLATSPALFARKIDSDIEPEVCRLIDRDLLGIASD